MRLSAYARRHVVLLALFFMALYWAPLWAQAVDPTPPDPTSPTGGSPGDVISSQLVISYVFVWIAEIIKRTEAIPWFAEGAAVANRVMASIFAVIQTVGIGVTFDTAAGTLMVTGLSMALIVPAAVEFGRSYISQKLLYVLAFQKASLPTITVTEAGRADNVKGPVPNGGGSI